MTWNMRLLVGLWLLSFTDAVAAALAARQAFRVRTVTDNRMVFEWMSALGFGLALYSFEAFASVFVSIVSGPPADSRTVSYLTFSFGLRLVRTFGMWVVALTLLNGGTPGAIRRFVSWVLGRFGVMDRPIVPTPTVEVKVDDLTKAVDELREGAAVVASDLAESQGRADALEGEEAGASADAAARSSKTSKELADER